MSKRRYSIGVDIGATTVKMGIVDSEGKIICQGSAPADVEKGPEAFMDRLTRAIGDLIKRSGLNKDNFKGIGVGCPSWDGHLEQIGEAPNLPGFKGLKVGKILEERIGLPTSVDNDANAAADGERIFGGWGEAGDNLVVYTLGTGVGGGAIHTHPKTGQTSKIVGYKWRGAELGHVTIPLPPGRKSRQCGCKHYDCLEAHASATAVEGVAKEEVRKWLRKGKRTKIIQMVEEDSELGKIKFKSDPEKIKYITPKHVNLAAQAGDELALKIEDQTAFALAQGIRNVVQTFDPAIVIIAGEMGVKWKRLVRKTIKIFRELPGVVPAQDVRIEVSKLKNPGILGAAGLVEQNFEKLV